MHLNRLSNKGFTLVEVLVVIVVISIVTSLIVLNIDSIAQRKAMLARDTLMLDIQRIGRESADQSQVLALDVLNATDVAPMRYQVIQYNANNATEPSLQNNTESTIRNSSGTAKWQILDTFKLRELPDQVSIRIASTDNSQQNANGVNRARSAQMTEFFATAAPQLIWFGNGEVKPVTIQFFSGNNAIGTPIVVDYLGNIADAE